MVSRIPASAGWQKQNDWKADKINRIPADAGMEGIIGKFRMSIADNQVEFNPRVDQGLAVIVSSFRIEKDWRLQIPVYDNRVGDIKAIAHS